MPLDRTNDTHRRQRDPLSCHSCRSKKLKCDRQRPCSNCTTRRLTCEYLKGRPTGASDNGVPSDDSDLYAQNLALKARVEKLEQAVFGEQSDINVTAASTTLSSSFAAASDANGERAARDAQWLEGIGNRIADMLPSIAVTAQVTVLPHDQFLHTAKQPSTLRPMFLPPEDVSMAYLTFYEKHIDSVQPIMHIASTRAMIEDVYAKLRHEQPVHSGSIALILATCAYVELWEIDLLSPSASLTTTDATSTILANQALSTFENACLVSHISVELVQAAILLIFHFGHLEGISFQPRLLLSRAITIARALGLHTTDTTRADSANLKTQAQIIDAEVRRRVWWHLASTDWLFAYMEGPHEGIYSIQPLQMAVNLPRNITNEDLSTQDAKFERAGSEPTVMSFFLQRIKLAILCREVIDFLLSTFPSMEIDEVSYEQIVSFDAKFGTLIDSLPTGLRLDTTEEMGSFENSVSYGQMVIQHLLANLLIHTRRCRLHIPFMIQYKTDQRHILSRHICLEAARTVFRAWSGFQSEDMLEAYRGTLRLGSIFGHVLLATTILVIDFCVNRPSVVDEEQIAEVRQAIKIAEDARESSRIASAFWESLTDVLRKHQVHLPAVELTNGVMSDNGRRLGSAPGYHGSNLATHDAQSSTGAAYVSENDQVMDYSASSDDIWQQLLENQTLTDPQSWDAFLNDLDLRAA